MTTEKISLLISMKVLDQTHNPRALDQQSDSLPIVLQHQF